MNSEMPCACGICDLCRRRAALCLASYVLEERYGKRKRSYDRSNAEEHRYVHRKLRFLLAMTGLAEEDVLSEDERRRSLWGEAMRSRQLDHP